MKRLIQEMKSMKTLDDDFQDSSNPEISRWLEYADKELAVLLFPNITRTMLESWEAFGYINSVPHFHAFQKIILRSTGAFAMRLANGKIKKKYSIQDEREALVKAINVWTREGLRGKHFHGGEKADLADVAVYGCLKSIEDFTTFAWLLGEADKDLLVWYNRMGYEIGESSCIERI